MKKALFALYLLPFVIVSCSSNDEPDKELIKKEIISYMETIVNNDSLSIDSVSISNIKELSEYDVIKEKIGVEDMKIDLANESIEATNKFREELEDELFDDFEMPEEYNEEEDYTDQEAERDIHIAKKLQLQKKLKDADKSKITYYNIKGRIYSHFGGKPENTKLYLNMDLKLNVVNFFYF